VKAASLPVVRGDEVTVEGEGLMGDLPARIAEMEGEIRTLRDTNRRKFILLYVPLGTPIDVQKVHPTVRTLRDTNRRKFILLYAPLETLIDVNSSYCTHP
jgi:hypothetical protein